MKYLTALFFPAAILLFFTLSFHTVTDFSQDLGRHLLIGKIIRATGAIPQTNLLSFTHPNFPFTNSHWLAEVVFYLLSSPLNLLGLKVIIFVSAMTLTLMTAWQYSKSLLATAVAFCLLVPVLLERTDIRPEIFSFLFVAVFMHLLLLNRTKLLFLLPLIEIIWVNTHIYFILGPILCLIFFQKKYWYVTFLTCLATVVNPNFLTGALFPIFVLQNYGYSIVENQQIFFLQQVTSNPNIWYFETAVVGLVLSSLFVELKKITYHHLLLGGLIILPIIAIRNFPLFFLLELPLFAYILAHSALPLRRYEKFIFCLVLALTLLRAGRLWTNQYYLSIDSAKRFGFFVEEPGKKALDFITDHKLLGPILNNFDMGSYIAYRLYPREKVFVDGRPEAYPKEFFQEVYIPLQQSPENFAVAKEHFKFSTIIFSHRDGTPWAQQFLSFIVADPDFRLVYLDSYAVVFAKDTNLKTVDPDSLLATSVNYLDSYYLARVAAIFGWEEISTKLAAQSISNRPTRSLVFF